MSEVKYLKADIHKVKSNKALTIRLTKKQAENFLAEIEKDAAYSYYVKVFTDSIAYSDKEELKSVFIYISSKFKINMVDENGYCDAVDVPKKSKVTVKFENGFVNAIRIDQKYNPLEEF